MTATNHALTGAVVILALKEPVFALPLALISHFILDVIPHFGVHEDDVVKRNGHWLFRRVVGVDVVLVVCSLIIVPLIASVHISGWWILAAMLAALAPDAVWIYRFIHEVRTKLARPHGRFARFHQWIQWSEKPWGLAIEIVWFSAMIVSAAALV